MEMAAQIEFNFINIFTDLIRQPSSLNVSSFIFVFDNVFQTVGGGGYFIDGCIIDKGRRG